MPLSEWYYDEAFVYMRWPRQSRHDGNWWLIVSHDVGGSCWHFQLHADGFWPEPREPSAVEEGSQALPDDPNEPAREPTIEEKAILNGLLNDPDAIAERQKRLTACSSTTSDGVMVTGEPKMYKMHPLKKRLRRE